MFKFADVTLRRLLLVQFIFIYLFNKIDLDDFNINDFFNYVVSAYDEDLEEISYLNNLFLKIDTSILKKHFEIYVNENENIKNLINTKGSDCNNLVMHKDIRAFLEAIIVELLFLKNTKKLNKDNYCIVLDSYLSLSKLFFSEKESKFINAIIERLGFKKDIHL